MTRYENVAVENGALQSWLFPNLSHLEYCMGSGRRSQKRMPPTMNNPTINELAEAYLADRRNPFAERKCKHPSSLASHLKIVRALWGEMTVNDFAAGSKARVKAQVAAWRAAGLSPHTVRKRVSILKTVFRFAIEEELIERSQEPIIKLPPQGAPRERFVDPVKELPALLRAADHPDTPDHIRRCLHLSLRTGQRQGPSLRSPTSWRKRALRHGRTKMVQ